MEEKTISINVNHELLDEFIETLMGYRCRVCKYSSNSKKKIYHHCLQHFLEQQSTTVFICSKEECSRAFATEEETRVHMKEEHKKETGVKKNREKRYACKHSGCKLYFSKPEFLETHSSCHSGDVLKCILCTQLFDSWQRCALHLFKEHRVDCGLLKCTLCKNYWAYSSLALENHMRVHRDLKALICTICGATVKDSLQLKAHKASHTEADVQSEKNRFKQCSTCFKIYATSRILRKHREEVHSKLRKFVCSICGHSSARKALLVLHQRQHTGEKAYSCTHCEYKTADHNSLRNHIMTHTGVRPYRCGECNYSAIRCSHFKRHIRNQHPDSNIVHSCTRCEFITVSIDRYTRHVSDHLTGLIKDTKEKTGENDKSDEISSRFPAWSSVGAEEKT